MIERPILFSAPMVRAILEDRKTHTRRIVTPQLPENACLAELHGQDYLVEELRGKLSWFESIDGDAYPCDRKDAIQCPYGQPGDQLWVRESFSFHEAPTDPYFLPHGTPGEALGIHYWADGNPEWGNWDKPKPSIHMPRRASRISLELTGVRIERLHAITEADAKAEGVETDEFMEFLDWAHSVAPRDVSCEFPTLRGEFQKLWEKINGTDSWDANPWVWVIEFAKVAS